MVELQTSPGIDCPNFGQHLVQVNSKANLQTQINSNTHSGEEVLLKSQEFENKMRVLKDLEFIENDVLTMRGKFAQHISSADLIILTLFIFDGGLLGKILINKHLYYIIL